MWGCFSNNHRGKILHSVISNYHYSSVSPTGLTLLAHPFKQKSGYTRFLRHKHL
jgi:hypothetical protein